MKQLLNNKDVIKNLNEALKYSLISNAIEIVMKHSDTPTKEIKSVIVRILFKCTQSDEYLDDGVNLFNYFFIDSTIYEIDEAIASVAMKLYSKKKFEYEKMMYICDYIFSKIKVTRRVFDSLFEYCVTTCDGNFAMYLLRYGISQQVHFINENYESCLESQNIKDIVKNVVGETVKNAVEKNVKENVKEIMKYMLNYNLCNFDKITDITQKTKDIDSMYISEKTACILENVFNNAKYVSTIDYPKFILGETGKRDILNNIEKTQLESFKSMVEFIAKNPTDHVIDGANVGYDIDANGKMFINFKKIDIVVKKLSGNIVIFLYEQHLIKTKLFVENLILNNNNDSRRIIVKGTPRGMNDDYSWMYSAIYNDAMFVSNDEMTDHYCKLYSNENSRLFRLWKESNQITYMFQKNDEVILNMPPKYITTIHKDENNWYFPVINKKWLCLFVESDS